MPPARPRTYGPPEPPATYEPPAGYEPPEPYEPPEQYDTPTYLGPSFTSAAVPGPASSSVPGAASFSAAASGPGPAVPATPENLHHQAGTVPGDATRYLCAAAWLDRRFRAALIEELVEQSFRIPAPSPGTDLVRVLHEALTARRWEAGTGLFCLLVLLGSLPVLGVGAGLAALVLILLLTLAGGLGPRRMDHRLGLEVERLMITPRAPRATGWRGTVAGVGRILAGLALVVAAATYLYGPLEGSDLDRVFVPDLFGPVGAGLLVELAVLWLAAARLRYRLRRRLSALVGMDPTPVPPPEPRGARAAAVYERLGEQQAGPELLYQRQAPLVGLGDAGRIWRMTFELRPSAERAAQGRAPDPIDTTTLYRSVAARVRALAQDPRYPEDSLRGLSVTDRVFRPSLRDDAPASWLGAMSGRAGEQVLLEPAWADLLSRSGHERLRHYLAIRVGSWQEEVVVTVLVRASTRGGLLYLEWLPYVLGPVAQEYHVVDLLGHRSGFMHAMNALGWSARRFGGDTAIAVGQLGQIWQSRRRAARLARRYRHLTRAGYAVDYAPRSSVRELGAGATYQNIFQEHDVQRFLSTVTERVFSAVGAELRARGYDSAAFEEQSQSITNINNGGVQVVGSTVHGPVAGGAGAKVDIGKGKGKSS
ncbi:hypothetical protein ACIQ9P_05920 [Kitasatospora sp. NPDC094019]|uniref:hypothetical protein n=1 Tax=Kitasatospora sp. NPDC094019 TaxID=3364091 RepID=UPI0038062228